MARAFDQVHAEAVRLAGTEAQLRSNLNAMFISLSRRSVPLIDRLTRMIDNLEQNEDDPDQLSHLFSMDHLVTRMRRNSENLLVLAGEEPVRKWSEPVPLSDVARAASAEIEQYGRVSLTVQPGITVSGQARPTSCTCWPSCSRTPPCSPPGIPRSRWRRRTRRAAACSSRSATRGSASRGPARRDELAARPPARGGRVGVPAHGPVRGLPAGGAARHQGPAPRGRPQGLTALVWLPGNLTSREQPLTVGMHSRPRPEGTTFNEITAFGDDPTPALGAALEAAHGTSGLRQRTTGRPGGGRHRLSLLATSGDQPVVAAAGRRRGRSGSRPRRRPAGRRPGPRPRLLPRPLRPPLPVPRSPGLRAAGRWGPACVDWSASAPADPGLRSADPGLRSADLGGWPGGGPPGQASVTRQTQAGLPQRVPRSNGGFDD